MYAWHPLASPSLKPRAWLCRGGQKLSILTEFCILLNAIFLEALLWIFITVSWLSDWSQGMLVVIRVESFAFQFAIHKFKDLYIQNYNFAYCFVSAWNLVAHKEGERRLRVTENRVSRRMFGLKRDEVKRKWRKLHYEDLNDLYSSRNIVRVIKSRRMRWAGHVARVGRGEMYTGFWWGDLRKGGHLEDLHVDGLIILVCIFQKWHGMGMDWTDLAEGRDRWHAVLNAVSIKREEFLNCLSTS